MLNTSSCTYNTTYYISLKHSFGTKTAATTHMAFSVWTFSYCNSEPSQHS